MKKVIETLDKWTALSRLSIIAVLWGVGCIASMGAIGLLAIVYGMQWANYPLGLPPLYQLFLGALAILIICGCIVAFEAKRVAKSIEEAT